MKGKKQKGDLSNLKRDIQQYADHEKARILSRFFKTGAGEYGEGDRFIGVTVPEQRSVVKKYLHLSLEEIEELLHEPIHEYRLTALLILTNLFPRVNEQTQAKIVHIYLKNRDYINNWDLIDLSAPKILGLYLIKKPEERKTLYRLASSKSLWERRIAILVTSAFIREDDFSDTLKISRILLQDSHDLIHKAVGWMLREVGKRNLAAEKGFLDKHYKEMPRTMLRYAIERFPQDQRLKYLKK